MSQVATPSGGKQPKEKGIRKVANNLGLDKDDVQRAVKVASITEEAKQAARAADLDDYRSALLTVASEKTADAQVAKVGEIVAAKAKAKPKRIPILRPATPGGSGQPCERHADRIAGPQPDSRSDL